MKDGFSYVLTTVLLVGMDLLQMNTVITTLILLATLIYWVQKNYGQYKKNKKEEN